VHSQTSKHNEEDGHSVLTTCHTTSQPPFYIFKTFHSLTFALVTLQLPCRLLTRATTASKLPPRKPEPTPTHAQPISPAHDNDPEPEQTNGVFAGLGLAEFDPSGFDPETRWLRRALRTRDRARGKIVKGEKLASAKPVGVVEGEKVE
jgi:hypothetical protein